MKVTMAQIVDFRNNGDIFDAASLPLKSAYKLNKIKKNVEKEMEFYADKFQEILDKYAKKNEDGSYEMSEDRTQILIQDGMVDECNAELDALQALEVDIDNYGLSIDDFGDNVNCTPEELEAIMPFLN